MGTLVDRIIDYIDDKVQNLNPPNIMDAVACECKLHGTETIGTAVTQVISSNQHGLYPLIPIGGTASPEEQEWGNAFTNWMSGRGPRPRQNGHNACDLF